MATGEFTDLERVKTVSRITNEVPDDELQEFINYVNQDILREHGYPVARSWTYIDDSRGSYFVNINRQPVYKIDRVFVNGSLLDSSSWTGNTSDASVALGSDLTNSADGSIIMIDFIPHIYHNLATFKAAKDVIESQYLISTEGGQFPRTAWLTTRISGIMDEIPNNVMYRSSECATWNANTGDYIDQTGLGEDL